MLVNSSALCFNAPEKVISASILPSIPAATDPARPDVSTAKAIG